MHIVISLAKTLHLIVLTGKTPSLILADMKIENIYENIYFMILNKRVQINIIIIFNIITAIR